VDEIAVESLLADKHLSSKPTVYEPKKSVEYMERLYRSNFKKDAITHRVQAATDPIGARHDRYTLTVDRAEYKMPYAASNLLVDYR
jgi:hypothetical protein